MVAFCSLPLDSFPLEVVVGHGGTVVGFPREKDSLRFVIGNAFPKCPVAETPVVPECVPELVAP